MNKKRYSMVEHVGEALDIIRGKSDIILLGLTGGIASGKSTVAHMLGEMGCFVIDFDILSRRVVEPEKPAWQYIVDYFGGNILHDNGTIDRKKLSGIVFQDEKKREMLEEFIYPHIADEFIRQIKEIATEESGVVIQAVVPLLIEGNMQKLFHKVIVVYIPREKQIERLMERDVISRHEADNIIKAQMPIDEKIAHADFVINNENSLEETKEQVKDLWRSVRRL